MNSTTSQQRFNSNPLNMAALGVFMLTALMPQPASAEPAQAVTPAATPSNTAWQWHLPAHIPEPRVPSDNPMSEAGFQLGRRLFYDARLSANQTIACASCHLQHLAFTDGKAVSLGSTGEATPRSAPSIANAAYHPTITWANYSIQSLERHATVPMFGDNPIEMGLDDNNKAAVIARFRQNPDYAARFASAFPGEADPVTMHNLINALAIFMRGVTSFNSRYDQAQQGKLVFSPAEARGEKLFFSAKAQCSQCHGSFNFNDQVVDSGSSHIATPFHNTGLYNIDGKGGFPEPNRGILELSGKAEDMGAFRAPSLRNVAITAPYMHDGSIATLEEVIDVYAAHGRKISAGPYAGDGRASPLKDERINRITLNASDKADLLAFLKTLTDDSLLTNPRYADPFQASAQPSHASPKM